MVGRYHLVPPTQVAMELAASHSLICVEENVELGGGLMLRVRALEAVQAGGSNVLRAKTAVHDLHDITTYNA